MRVAAAPARKPRLIIKHLRLSAASACGPHAPPKTSITMLAQTRATGLKASCRAPSVKVAAPRAARKALVCRADGGFIGSTTNLIMVASTTAFLAAGRFGLAPHVKNYATAGLKLQNRGTVGLMTADPAGFTIVDVLAHGALGHIVGVGIVLGLRAIGN